MDPCVQSVCTDDSRQTCELMRGRMEPSYPSHYFADLEFSVNEMDGIFKLSASPARMYT